MQDEMGEMKVYIPFPDPLRVDLDDGPVFKVFPAIGWKAVHIYHSPPKVVLESLVCWLFKFNGEWEADGLVAADFVDKANSMSGFHIYIHEDDITDELRAAWDSHAQKGDSDAAQH
ncbi:hypothetical protein LCGC14_1285570 [marine sediment metagenome]|uniref:Uncharacterized protein n=1 Tax=marine sediment metagenome TaxID=412755 RepID=A0A0F9KU04_9ZZZZ